MSKRLNKRQIRELEELETLKAAEAAERSAATPQEESEEEEDSGVANPFAALGGEEPEPQEEEEAEEEAPAAVKKKVRLVSGQGGVAHGLTQQNKKKPKKKKKPAAAASTGGDTGAQSTSASTPAKGKKKGGQTPGADPLEGLDEVDRALAELKLKYGEDPAAPAEEPKRPEMTGSRAMQKFRTLLSVDPKNLDADAELRRFFGSKVGAKHRAISKIRYTLAKPKDHYPPPISLAGLSMKELTDEEVEELYDRRDWAELDPGERWYTFTHSPAWREIERQFLGAVSSHDPNELMALLQVYPWHVDTLLQMSEAYRVQADLGAASDFAERALYAFDRCLIPGFNVQSGSCRLDFDRVENRPMFMALHRSISYLGRRGCWSTAFNICKLLFALDPESDPHAAVLWIDFLAIKSGNGRWLLDMLEMHEQCPALYLWRGYPGLAYAKALALRAEEVAQKDKAHERSTEALLDAVKLFPVAAVLLADKLGINISPALRSHPSAQIEVGYVDDSKVVVHLLSHIYASRSEALWKEPAVLSWLQQTVNKAVPELGDQMVVIARNEVEAIACMPRDTNYDLRVPLHLCRHVLCSESTTSLLSFLPPEITSRPFHAYDPLPPMTAITAYDRAYFDPMARARGAGLGVRGLPDPRSQAAMFEQFLTMVRGMIGQEPHDWPAPMQDAFREFAGGRAAADMPVDQRAAMVRDLVRVWEEIVRGFRTGEIDFGPVGFAGAGGPGDPGADPGAPGAMPGAFPP